MIDAFASAIYAFNSKNMPSSLVIIRVWETLNTQGCHSINDLKFNSISYGHN
jgi:hypothetical protein